MVDCFVGMLLVSRSGHVEEDAVKVYHVLLFLDVEFQAS